MKEDLPEDLIQRLGALSPDKRALLEQRLQPVHRSSSPPPFLVPPGRHSPLPLSFAQERLWLLHHLYPESIALHTPSVFRIGGPLDVSALAHSLEALLQRHEVLRTCFPEYDGYAVQAIRPSMPLDLTPVSLRTVPPPAREQRLRRRITEEIQRPFNLNTGPLLRAALFHVDTEDHVLVLVVHHTISDGWSMGVLCQELEAFYEACLRKTAPSLPPLPLQYADYALWQRQQLATGALAPHRTYWTQQLAGAPRLMLPLDAPWSTVHHQQGARVSTTLSTALTASIKEVGRAAGATLFITLLTALKLLLYRHTTQTDIVVGTPIFGRSRPEFMNVAGCFLNMLALRTDLSDTPTFRTLLDSVQRVAFEAYSHQAFPFEKLVEDLQPERDLSRHPLFDVMLNFGDASWRILSLAGLHVRRMDHDVPIAQLALNLYAKEQEGCLHLDLVYQQALFSAPRMKAFLDQYLQVLKQAVTAPEAPLHSYSLVTPQTAPVLPDPYAVLEEPTQDTVTGQFMAWAQQTPDSIAISQGPTTWTYAQLAERSTLVAQALHTQGARPGDVIAVQGTPSFGLIASLLATFQQGGVLLPLDPRLPERRKRLMLQEAQAKLVLWAGADEEKETRHGRLSGLRLVSVDPDTGQPETVGALPAASTAFPAPRPEAAAYVFFTSGTTGVPKGILGCHKSLSHFLAWQRTTFSIGPGDRVAQLTGLSFDVVLRDVFLPLTSGATLCLPEQTMGPEETLSWLAREQITVLHTVPTLASFWLAQAPEDMTLSALRWVFFAGEPLMDALVTKWRAAFPNRSHLINLYGPTETTLVKCFYEVPAEPPPGILPIGRPLPNTQLLVLSTDDRLCGIGEPGEIVVRTPFRSLGYLNAPQADRRHFAPNPFRNDPNDVVYYTGDQGRYLPDGTVEILGRLDEEVKIRGMRINPNEITALLNQHPAVSSCFVAAQHDAQKRPSLTAYLVSAPPHNLSAQALRTYLRHQVPETMIPASFVFLEVLPRTPNGKIDRSALPNPAPARVEANERFVPCQTPTEETLASIWQAVFDAPQVNRTDNFFDLGGHSLLAIRMITQIREALGVELPIRSFFETPTLAELAHLIDTLTPSAPRLS